MAEIIDTSREDWHKALTPVSRHLGQFDGVLQLTESGGKLKVKVLEQDTGALIPCELPEGTEWEELARKWEGRRVLVLGCVNFYARDKRWLTHMETICEVKPMRDPTLMKGADFIGCIPDPYAAKDPVAFLRKIRGYDDDWD